MSMILQIGVQSLQLFCNRWVAELVFIHVRLRFMSIGIKVPIT